MKTLYGSFNESQMKKTKKSLRSSIFFLLLCVDHKTCKDYPNINVNDCIKGLQYKIAGLNSLLSYPAELVTVMSLLQSALLEYNNPDFNFNVYRKLILDAGAEVSKIKEG